MKTSSRWSRVLVLWLTTASVFHLPARALLAQGTVNFANTTNTRMTTNSTAVAPIGQSPNQTGNTAPGGQYTVGLYIAPAGTTDPQQFTLVGPTTPNAPVGGLFHGNPPGGFFAVLGNTGQPIAFQVRAWSSFAGPTFETASQPGGYRGVSAIGEVTPSTNGQPPALFGTGAGQVGGFVLLPPQFNPGFPPIVSITNLTNGSLFSAPAVVPVRVSASDSDGAVVSVYLFTNNSFAAQIPWPFNTTLSNLAPGHYTLRAQAVDNSGLFANSSPIIVRVASRPVLELAPGSNGPIQFQFNSATGINYVVESGTLTNFSPVITNAGTASPISYSETNGSATQRTYRVRLQ